MRAASSERKKRQNFQIKLSLREMFLIFYFLSEQAISYGLYVKAFHPQCLTREKIISYFRKIFGILALFLLLWQFSEKNLGAVNQMFEIIS